MSRGAIKRIEPIIAPETTPAGAEHVGFTPDGKHKLWKRVRRMMRAVPELDEKGVRVWVRNKNGDRLVPKNKAEIYNETQLFYTEPGLNNDRYEIPYVAPTAEQLKAAERLRLVKELGGGKLAERIVDRALAAGKTPDQVIEQILMGGAQAGAAADGEIAAAELAGLAVPAADAPLRELEHRGGPHWTLGNGEKFTGTREEAEAKQAALVEAEGPPLY